MVAGTLALTLTTSSVYAHAIGGDGGIGGAGDANGVNGGSQNNNDNGGNGQNQLPGGANSHNH